MFVLLYGLIFGLALAQTLGPRRKAAPGLVVLDIHLDLRQRLQRQRPHLYALGLALLIGSLTGWARLPAQGLVVMGGLALVALPVRYRFTSLGLDINGSVVHSWSEFDGYFVTGQRLQLHGFSRLDLWLTEEQQLAVTTILPHRMRATSTMSRRLSQSARLRLLSRG